MLGQLGTAHRAKEFTDKLGFDGSKRIDSKKKSAERLRIKLKRDGEKRGRCIRITLDSDIKK